MHVKECLDFKFKYASLLALLIARGRTVTLKDTEGKE